MELRELRYFLAVAREQSITRAARFLYIAQPSLSKQMQNLEKEVGKQLFVRGARKITLTETGMLLKKRAEELLELYGKTEAELSAPQSGIAGDIYIGGGESRVVRTVAAAANAMQREYPSVRFHFFSGDASDVTEKLDQGLIDFGILVGLGDLSDYEALRLPLTDRWGVLMRRDSPLAAKEFITPEDLADVPLICSQQALRPGSLIDRWFGGNTDRLNVRATYNLLYNASLLVMEGMGYAMGLANLINTENTALCFKPLSPSVEPHLDLVWKKYAVFSKASELFLDRIRSAMRGE